MGEGRVGVGGGGRGGKRGRGEGRGGGKGGGGREGGREGGGEGGGGREGREGGGGGGYGEKYQIQCRKLQKLSTCKVMLEEGGRKRQGGKENAENCLIHQRPKAQRETGDWRNVHSTIVFPKLPIERKGVWPRLVRWNGVTPGRQRMCWCEAVWGGEGDSVR